MGMKDFDELYEIKEEALKKLLWRCYGIVYVFSKYDRDELIGKFGEDTVKDLDALELAYESADKDLNECLSVAAETASFKD